MGLNYVDISIAPPIFTETTIIPGKQGIQGIQGDPGVFVGTTEPTDESVKVWINPDGMESDIKGDKGDKGDTGNGISAIEIAYNQSTSNTTAPTAGWVATPPSVASGSYLWTRLTITMTEGNPVVAYTIAKQGVKGDTGAAAGFGTPTATIDGNVGTPKVTVTASGANTSKVFNFAFENMKGERGEKGPIGTIYTPSVSNTGILSWTNDGGLTNPQSRNIADAVKESMGGYTIQTSTSIPTVANDKIITFVTEA